MKREQVLQPPTLLFVLPFRQLGDGLFASSPTHGAELGCDALPGLV